ncbi:MAG: PA domain-containing protein [Pyrinomonadaceae bacterium]
MTTKTFRPLLLALLFLTIMLGASRSTFATATIVILNNDAAGVGFNDTTAATPVGGNNGTTLGQQRLNAFQAAADKWGATLDSPITITIRAQWAAQTCTATSAVLGSAGAIGIYRDFTGAPFAGTWYNESLTSKLFGADPNPAQPEINATFNINLGQPGCLTGTFFYLGLDGNHGTNIDLVTVLTHEFGHGLGFQTFGNSQTGAQNSGFPSIYDRFLMDLTTGKSWLQMTNAERAASAIKAHKLAWNGPQVQADVPNVLAFGIPILKVNSPAGIAGNYDVGTAAYGPQPSAGGITGNLLLANDGTAPVTDGCEAFPAGFFTGQIAVIDRGTCSFKTKTLNAQNAGATAVIIVNNVAGTPAPGLGDDATITTPITIPTVSLTLPDGNTIKAQLGGTVNGIVQLDMSVRAGADQFGKALLYTPDPFVSGSTVSHWDTIAFPNQLMEPNISGDLTHEVTPPNDLTFSELRDIGWVASAIPSAISKTSGDTQNTALSQQFTTPISVTVSPAIAGITVTWTTNNGGSGAGATFPSTGGRSAVSVTNASGVATAPPLTANGQSGQLSLNATAPGAGTTTFALAIDPTPVFGPSCATDTTQADFAAGVTNNTDVNTSPGDVVLLNPANPDQVQSVATNSGTGLNTTQWLGQTFVPGVTGKLAKIDMALFCASCSGTDQPITVEIRTTTGSPALPTSTVLATTTIPGFNSGTSSTLTASFATPATLTAGTTYAYTMRLVTNRTGTYAAVFGNGPTDYANGNRVISTNSGASWTVPTSTGIARDLVFTTYMQTGNAASGDFVSSLKDSNPPFAGTSQWGTLSWNATVPAGTTLQFQAAASNNFGGPFNFVGPNGTAGTFFTNGASLSQFNGFRYLKYKAFFTTTDGTLTPTLADVTICFNNPSAVLNISMTADRNPAPVELNFNYKPVITNTGDTSATNVTLVDVLPALVTFTAASSSQGSCTYESPTNTVTCNIGTMAPGSTVNVQITVKPRNEGTLNNTATITAGNWNPATGNNSASVNGLPAVKQADLSIQKTAAPNPIFVSQNVTYTLVAKNNSTVSGATGVVITDSLPASMKFVSATTSQGSLITPPVGSSGIVTANVGSLATGATATVTVTVTASAAGAITNTATVTGNESDPVAANNTDSATTTVTAVNLQKVLLVKQVLTGGCENTTGNVYLTGPAPAGGLTISLSTTSLAGVTVPASVFIPAGQTVSPAFNVTTTPVATKQVGLVNATLGASTVSRGLTINVGSGSCPP